MDKYEFNIKVEQIKKMVNKSDYETAMKIADTIDWKRVRNANLLSMIAQVYEKNDEYQVAKDILLLAFERAPIGKRLLYKLTELAIKEGNIPEAEAYYREFCDLAPDDPRQHLLRYLILKAKGAPSEQLVHSLERYTDIELEEKWLYELAELYCQAGNKQDCIKMCDRITLMFGMGKYVDKAMELKQKYAPLTQYQMSLVENRDKYESNLRNVEQQFERAGYPQTGDEFDDAPVMHSMDDELVAHLHQAEAEESLAKEMSRISIDDYIEDSPMGATRVMPEIRDIRNYMPENRSMPYQAGNQFQAGRQYGFNSQYQPTGQYEAGNQYQPTGQYGASSQYQPTGQYGANSQYQPTGQYEANSQYQPTGQYETNSQYQPTGQYEINSQYQPTGQHEANSQYQPTGQHEANSQYQPTGQYGAGSQYQPTGQYGANSQYQPTSQYEAGSQYQPTGQHEANSQYQPTGQYEANSQYQQTSQYEANNQYQPAGRYGTNSQHQPTIQDGATVQYQHTSQSETDEQYNPENSQSFGGYPQADANAYSSETIQNEPYTGNTAYKENHQYGHPDDMVEIDSDGIGQPVNSHTHFTQENQQTGHGAPASQGMSAGYGAFEAPNRYAGQSSDYEENRSGSFSNQNYMESQGEFAEFTGDWAEGSGDHTAQRVSQNAAEQEDQSRYVINTQAGFANHYVVKEQPEPEGQYPEEQITIQELQNAAMDENSLDPGYSSGLAGQAIKEEGSVPPLSNPKTIPAGRDNLKNVSYADEESHHEDMPNQPFSDTPEKAVLTNGSIEAEDTMESSETMDSSQNRNIVSVSGFSNENLLSNQSQTYGKDDADTDILELKQDLRTRLAPDAMMPEPELNKTYQGDVPASRNPYVRPDNIINPSEYLQRQYNADSQNGTPLVKDMHTVPSVSREYPNGDQSNQEYPNGDFYPESQMANHIMIEARSPEKGFEMAVEALKQIHKELGTKNQVVKISGGKLSHKGIFAVANKLAGKDLIIEEAGDLTPQALDELNQMMEADTTGMIVVLIDNPRQLEELHHNNPVLARRFECIGSREETVDEVERAIAKQIDVQESIAKEVIPRQPEKPPVQERPVERNTASAMAAFREEREQHSNSILRPVATGQSEAYMQKVKHVQMPESEDDSEELELEEFAQYACRYASEIDCSITGKSKLALYERIEIMEEDGIPLTRANAEALIEEAADKAEKPSLGKLITGVFSSKYDKEGLLILKEHHFID